MGKHPSTRYEGKMMGKKKLEELAKQKKSPVYYDEDAGFYKKDSFSRNTKRVKFLKQQSNRKIRRSEDIPTGQSNYQKLYDYAWELY